MENQPSDAIVHCDCCWRKIWRPRIYVGKPPEDMPPVHTRTLVGESMLPSCSEACAEVLRSFMSSRP